MMGTPMRGQPDETLARGGRQGDVLFGGGCFSKASGSQRIAKKKPEKSDQDKVHLCVS